MLSSRRSSLHVTPTTARKPLCLQRERWKKPTKWKRIQVAFDCRLLPNLIEGNQPHDLSQAVDDEQIRRMHVQRIILNEDQTILPSTLLSHESWVKYAVDLLALDKTSSTLTDVTSFDKEKADHLLRKLEVRYKLHVNTRINNASKRNHWVLALAYKNFPVVAACMILSSHLAMDIKCLGRLSCLLAPWASPSKVSGKKTRNDMQESRRSENMDR